MKPHNAKRIIKRFLGAGVWRIKIRDPAKLKDAITAEDLKNLIKEKAIEIKNKHGVSRARGKITQLKRAKGRRRGKGTKRGTKNARANRKELWITRVRSQRAFIKQLLNSNKITRDIYRKLYTMIKGNYFKSKSSIITYLNDQGQVKEKIILEKSIDKNKKPEVV